MNKGIHPTAVIDRRAELGSGVWIGAHAVIGADVVVGDDTEVGASAHIEGPTTLGRGNRIYPKATIGFDPQDLKWQGESVRLQVGDGNVFREFCTVHRGTGLGGGVTMIGNHNLFMVYTHIAHDCHVGNHTIFSNNGTLAGHVEVRDHSVVGAFSAVQQFCRVGAYAYIGGYTIVTKDALPYVKTVGHKPACYGVNSIGLERRGFDAQRIARIEGAVRILLRSGLNTTQALEKLEKNWPDDADVGELISFVETSDAGVIKALPGAGRNRGGSTE
jgi:UDP-N-acetylglucosamine acyltransferase